MKYSSRCWPYRSTFIQIRKTSCAVAYYRIQSMICRHASELSPAGDHHSRPMTMTSTTSPLWSSTYCSVFGGSINNPLALRMLIRRLLIWLPGRKYSHYSGSSDTVYACAALAVLFRIKTDEQKHRSSRGREMIRLPSTFFRWPCYCILLPSHWTLKINITNYCLKEQNQNFTALWKMP